MGAVYQAEHLLMRKRLAIKVLHPEMTRMREVVARFEREAMAAAHIDHPNVATATDFGKLDDGSFFLVLEFVEGTSLRDALSDGRFAVPRVLTIARQITSALQRAHGMGIVHRDLKPENVMLVERNGEKDFVKVLDFGIAKVPVGGVAGAVPSLGSQKDGANTVLTQAGMVYGTPEYMAPEQAMGQDVDLRADLYALGVMMYEMLAGVRPFDHDSKVTLLGMHVTAPVPPIAEKAPGVSIPEDVEAVVRRLLAKDSNDRYTDARELEAALFTLMGTDGSGNRASGPPRTSTPPVAKTPSTSDATDPPPAQVPSSSTIALPKANAPPVKATVSLPSPVVGMVALPLQRKRQRRILFAMAAGALVLGLVVVIIAKSLATRDPGSGKKTRDREPTISAPPPENTAQTPTPDKPPETDFELDDVDPAHPDRVPNRTLERVERLLDRGDVSSAIGPLSAFVRKNPESVDGRKLLVRAQSGAKNHKDAMREAESLIKLDPESAQDPKIIDAVRDAALEREEAAFGLLERRMGATGADILYDIGFGSSGTRAPAVSERAKKALTSADVRSHASAALAVALDLRQAKDCEGRRAVLVRAREDGDARALVVLTQLKATRGCGFAQSRDCYPCLRKDNALAKAIAAIEERTKK